MKDYKIISKLDLTSMSDDDLEAYEHLINVKRNLASSIYIDLNARRENKHFDFIQERLNDKKMQLSATVSCMDFSELCDRKPIKTLELRDAVMKQKNIEYKHFQDFVRFVNLKHAVSMDNINKFDKHSMMMKRGISVPVELKNVAVKFPIDDENKKKKRFVKVAERALKKMKKAVLKMVVCGHANDY